MDLSWSARPVTLTTYIWTGLSSVSMSSSVSGTTPRTWRYFLPRMDSNERHRSVSMPGSDTVFAAGDILDAADGVGGANGLVLGVPPAGKASWAKKVMPGVNSLVHVAAHHQDASRLGQLPDRRARADAMRSVDERVRWVSQRGSPTVLTRGQQQQR